MGLAWCPLVLEKKCKLTNPYNCGSRNIKEYVSTEIKISPSAIKKKHQNGSSLVSVGPREKCKLTTPPQFWVKESICVNVKSKFHLWPLRKSTKMGLAWCPLVLEKKCELTTPHNFGSRNPCVDGNQNFTFGH